MISAKQVQDFFNGHFFDNDGNVVSCPIQLRLSSPNQQISLPAVEINPENTIQDIFEAINTYLKKNPAMPAVSEQKEMDSPENIEKVSIGKSEYVVEEYQDEKLKIKNLSSGDYLKENSPRWYQVRKAYQNR